VNQDAEYIDKDVAAFKELERKKKEEKERRMKQHQQSLASQIVNGKQKEAKMAQHEYMLNKELLDVIDHKSKSPETKFKKPF
jgi:phage terminase small subunit